MVASPRFPTGGLALVLIALTSSQVAASPLEDSTLGGAVFTGPVHSHGTAIYLNPAALGLASRGSYLYLDGSLRFDSYDIHRQRILDPDSGLQAGTPVQASTLAPSGSFAWYSVGSKIAIGAAVNLVTLETFVEDGTVPGDEPRLGYHVLEGGQWQHVRWRVPITGWQWILPVPTVAASYRATQKLFFGIGVSLRFSSLSLSFLRDTALEAGNEGINADCDGSGMACGIENPQAAETYEIDVATSDFLNARNLVVNAGIMYRFIGNWWLGLHYQSPPGFLSSLTFVGTAEITPAQHGADTPPEPVIAQAEVSYRLPQTIAAGIRGPAFWDYDLIMAARWQNLSRQDQLDIRVFGRDLPEGTPEWYPRYRGFSDVWVLETGLEQREDRPTHIGDSIRTRIGARLRMETAATATAALSPMQVDGPNLTASVGSALQLANGLMLTLSYGFTVYPQETVTDSMFDPQAQLDCVASGYRLADCTAAAQGRALPTAAGTYGRTRHAIRAAIHYFFAP